MNKLSIAVLSGVAAIGMIGCSSAPTTTTNANLKNANANTAMIVNNNVANANGQVIDSTGNGNMSNMSNMGSRSATGAEGFMTEAAQGGMAEVELGKLASTKGQNASVKQFGQQMMADHTRANNELKQLASKKNVTLPTDVGAEHKESMEKLSKLSGAEFDKEYVAEMVKDHEKDVADFQTQSESATDADVKAFAAKTLPTLKSHLEMIRGIQGKMK